MTPCAVSVPGARITTLRENLHHRTVVLELITFISWFHIYLQSRIKKCGAGSGKRLNEMLALHLGSITRGGGRVLALMMLVQGLPDLADQLSQIETS